MFNKLIVLMVLLILLSSAAFAQTATDKWRLIWDPNIEEDMFYYEIYKDTYAMPTTQVDTFHHVASALVLFEGDMIFQWIDTDIVPGVQYWYRLKAVDSTELESDYSTVVSGAIPVFLEIPEQVTQKGNSFPSLNLDDYADDMDYSSLFYSVSGGENIFININNNIATPSCDTSFTGSETFIFTVVDADSFWSTGEATFTVLGELTDPNLRGLYPTR